MCIYVICKKVNITKAFLFKNIFPSLLILRRCHPIKNWHLTTGPKRKRLFKHFFSTITWILFLLSFQQNYSQLTPNFNCLFKSACSDYKTLSEKKMVMSFLTWKGYPHSMIIFAYFRMKFSSLKMNNDREEEPPVPGRLMSAAFLAKWRSEPSEGPQYSPPSWPSWPPTVKFAILQKKNSLLRIKVIYRV